MTSFDNNPRAQQERLMRPYADALYRKILPGYHSIKRYNGNVFDRKFAIDGHIIFTTGQILTIQEKFLSRDKAIYQSLSVEYMQNPETQEPGDWFNAACQLYFVGYINETGDGFAPWALVDYTRLTIETLRGRVGWHLRSNQDGHARASFRYAHFDGMPPECILARSR